MNNFHIKTLKAVNERLWLRPIKIERFQWITLVVNYIFKPINERQVYFKAVNAIHSFIHSENLYSALSRGLLRGTPSWRGAYQLSYNSIDRDKELIIRYKEDVMQRTQKQTFNVHQTGKT